MAGEPAGVRAADFLPQRKKKRPAHSILSRVKKPAKVLLAIVSVGIYLFLCCFWLLRYDGLSHPDGENATVTNTDAVYFSMMTLSTVGYGDFSPSTGSARLFVIAMILVGVGIVFPIVGGAVDVLLTPFLHKCKALLDRLLPPKYIDIDESGSKDFPVPPYAPVFYLKSLLPSVLIIILVQIASAFTFTVFEPGWSFLDALYHCFVTVSTVGYGDQYIATQNGRLFASVHMLLGVCLFAEVISTIDEARTERALALQRFGMIQQELSPAFFERLTEVTQEMRPHDDDVSGLNETEFVLAMLLELEAVDPLSLKPLFKKFRALDIVSDGRLCLQDVQATAMLSKEERKKVRRKNTKVLQVREKMKSTRKVAPKRAPKSTTEMAKTGPTNGATTWTTEVEPMDGDEDAFDGAAP